MINTVLGEIYHSYSESELRKLDIYLSTSNWQYSETVIKCHECFQEYKQNDMLGELDKEIIYTSIYDDEDYNDSKLRFVMSRLGLAIKEFVIHAEIENENVFTEKVWMDFLLGKKLKKNIQYNLNKTNISNSSEYNYLHNYFKSQENSVQLFNYNKDVGLRFKSIKKIMSSAELFSDLVFIKNYCSLISFSNVYQSIFEELPMQKLDEIRKKNWGENHPEFRVYLTLLDLLVDKDRLENYYTYKATLFENFDIWNDEEKVNFLVALLNFSAQQINRGNTKFIDEQYNLFNYFEKEGIFQISTFINASRINNVVYTYLRKNEFEKAEIFVDKYASLLGNKLKDSCKHFNMARIYFEKSDYKKSLRELLRVDFSHNPGYSLNSKLLLLKNYFELEETEAFDSLCSSFKEFIRKNKVISNQNKILLSNFIKMSKRLYCANPSKLSRVRKDLEASKQIAEKNWLLAKATKTEKA